MPKITDTYYRLSPEWQITQEADALILNGGADALFSVALDSAEASFFSDLETGKKFVRSQLSRNDRRVLEQLVSAQAVVPVIEKSTVLKVKVVGARLPNLESIPKEFKITDGQDFDLMLIVRTGGTYAKLLQKLDYQSIKSPHLFVDLAFNHTVSIGPLVFVGETACIACLEGRIASRWGDKSTPKKPGASTKLIRTAGILVEQELARISRGDTSLVNTTVAWNIQDREVQTNALYKVVFCPVCNKNKLDGDGKLALPWV